MRAPPGLASLLEDGLIEAVLRPLQSGKEAQVYLVRCGGEVRIAKIYKAAEQRNFKNRSAYQEGRGTRNTRDQRAMKRRSSYGRSRDEEAWQSTEVEMIHRLRAAGVRVPEPFVFADGVLIMELVQSADGAPAPRLGDLRVSAEDAVAIHDALLRDVVRMLCAGVVHGDLSEFNVLVDDDGPVIIDLPQAVDASSNQNARNLLLRDVENLQRFVTRWVPGRKRANYAAEMWALYEVNELEPDTELTGVHEGSKNQADTDALLGLIADAEEDETMRRLQRGLAPLVTESDGRRVYINRDEGPQRRRKSSRGGGAKGQAPAKRKTAAKSGPPSPPSKAPSRDELIAQAIAARQAAAAAASAPKAEAPRGPERKRRRRGRGAEQEPATGSRSRQGERAPSESRTAAGSKKAAVESNDRKGSRGDSGSDERRRRRRRRPKRDENGERSAGTAGREGGGGRTRAGSADQGGGEGGAGRRPRKQRGEGEKARPAANRKSEARRGAERPEKTSPDGPPKRRRRRRRSGGGPAPAKTDG